VSTGRKREDQRGNFSSFLSRFDESADVGFYRFRARFVQFNFLRRVTVKRRAKKKPMVTLPEFRRIGVRFINRPTSMFTYKIAVNRSVYLGQELVVENHHGTSVVAVVQLDPPLPEGHTDDALKVITRRVAPLV
jgi:hypothetical protein